MRFGALVLPTDPWTETVRTVRHLDELGYHHVWVYDHLSWQRYRDRAWHATFPWLTGVAAVTQRIRLGTMVANPNVRHPLLLAKDAMTIDHISGGRITIGVGAGGMGFDATVLGQPPLSAGERADRLGELVAVLDGLLRGELTSHTGRWYTIDDGRVLPGCVQVPRVPIAVAAGGRRGIALAAARAEAWITYGDAVAADRSAERTRRAVAEQLRWLDDACERVGRDPSSVDRIFLIGNSDDRPLQSIEAFADFVGRYGELGFTDVVFHHPRLDDPIWNDPIEIVDEIAAHFVR